MKHIAKRSYFPLLFLLLLAVGLSFFSCGGEKETDNSPWLSEKAAGGYSEDYVLTPERKFCLRIAKGGDSIEVFDSGSGNLCGVLDFASRSSAGLYASFDIGLLDFSDRDGDNYSDFGIPMADGSMIWYTYRFGSDPAKEKDCFSFLEVQQGAFEVTSEGDIFEEIDSSFEEIDSSAVSSAVSSAADT